MQAKRGTFLCSSRSIVGDRDGTFSLDIKVVVEVELSGEKLLKSRS